MVVAGRRPASCRHYRAAIGLGEITNSRTFTGSVLEKFSS